MSDIVERLKKNERAFIFLSKDEKDLLQPIFQADMLLKLTKYGDFVPAMPDILSACDTYRISPDYQAEPEIEKCEVKTHLDGKLGYRRGNYTFELTDALDDPDFICYEYGEGDDTGSMGKFPRDTIYRCDGRPCAPARNPKYVLFKRSK